MSAMNEFGKRVILALFFAPAFSGKSSNYGTPLPYYTTFNYTTFNRCIWTTDGGKPIEQPINENL
jgi:hypothetical protein